MKEKRIELAVLSWVATEAHNYHLSYGTDIMEAESIAAESAISAWEKDIKMIVLPTIPFGVNTAQPDIYLDMNINSSTQLVKKITKVLIALCHMDIDDMYKTLQFTINKE